MIGPRASRKATHIGTGLVYLLFWPLYSDEVPARYACASVPGLASLYFFLVGIGILKDQSLLNRSTRSGHRQELLKGPLWYGLAHTILTIIFWRKSPTGITAITMLCAGDGAAEWFGRRFGDSNPLPHNPTKTWAGSIACAAFGFSTAVLYVQGAAALGLLDPQQPHSTILAVTAATSLVSAAAESLPSGEWDNVVISIAAAGTSWLLYGS
ncbi:hypothetical protein WJX84_001476 [Apatococcus fuscideae]|uniref:Phytol kinase n=1 Tax=Apatococcus fuscideae TaxID=2026836 RepID=A0AAW1THN7_9CHLO